MRISRIYIAQTLEENCQIECVDNTAHYLKNVLRMKVGRHVILFNGDGRDYAAVVDAVSKKSVSLRVQTAIDVHMESPLRLHLGCCLIKNDRMDWLLQKATELGVTHFYPLVSEYTDVKIPEDRLAKKMEHWQQVIISACEQSGRSRIPVLESVQPVDTWMSSLDAEYKAVLHPYQAQRLGDLGGGESVALLVGPEGGLTDAEVELAHSHDFHSISLGPRILRAETAPLVALSLFQHALGDM